MQIKLATNRGLSVALLGMFLAGCSSLQSQRNPSQAPSPGSDESFSSLAQGGRSSLHGMVLYGAGPYFLDHIPMLSEPHDFQIIAKVILKDRQGKVTTHNFSKETFTLRPSKNFSLNDYLARRFQKFSGSIHEGSFEQGGKVVKGFENISVEVVDFILRRQLPSQSEEERIDFSDGANTIFSVNLITAERNRQQIRNTTIEKDLWCVVGPDFMNECE